jgi:hypothetical protein
MGALNSTHRVHIGCKKIVVGNTEGNKSPGISKRKREANNKIYHKERSNGWIGVI